MTDINTLVAEMRAGLEGVTPGKWTVKGGANSHCFDLRLVAGDGEALAFSDGANAAHIARCSPSNIAALLDEIERLRVDLTHIVAERDRTFAVVLARVKAVEAGVERLRWERDYYRALAVPPSPYTTKPTIIERGDR